MEAYNSIQSAVSTFQLLCVLTDKFSEWKWKIIDQKILFSDFMADLIYY